MQPELFNYEFTKIFRLYGNKNSPAPLNPDLKLYKQLWNFLLPGDSYWFMVNYHLLELEFVSKEIEQVIGYTPSEFTIPFLNQIIHPEDVSWFLTFGNILSGFFSITVG